MRVKFYIKKSKCKENVTSLKQRKHVKWMEKKEWLGKVRKEMEG